MTFVTLYWELNYHNSEKRCLQRLQFTLAFFETINLILNRIININIVISHSINIFPGYIYVYINCPYSDIDLDKD